MRFGTYLLIAAAALLAGCAGYQRGSSVPEALRTIHIPAVENRSVYPMAGAIAAQQILDAVIEDGTFRPVAYDAARLQTQLVLSGVQADAVRYDQNHAILPEEYLVTLRLQLFVFDSVTGETLVNGKTLSAMESVLTRGDFQTGMVDALPRIARRLAQQVLEELHLLK